MRKAESDEKGEREMCRFVMRDLHERAIPYHCFPFSLSVCGEHCLVCTVCIRTSGIGKGVSELDDLALNTLGVWIGEVAVQRYRYRLPGLTLTGW